MNLANKLKQFDTRETLDGKYFDMFFYERKDSYEDEGFCGTAACAVGHAPELLNIPLKRNEDWNEYSTRVLIDFENEGIEWSWCFSGDWHSIDNTPKGAAHRISMLLDGKMPKGFEPYGTSASLTELSHNPFYKLEDIA